jgi:hypothetical protein
MTMVALDDKVGLKGPTESLNEEIDVPEENKIKRRSWYGKLVGLILYRKTMNTDKQCIQPSSHLDYR